MRLASAHKVLVAYPGVGRLYQLRGEPMQREFVPDLANCQNIVQLAVALGVDQQVLHQLAGDSQKSLYRTHRIPKRSRHRANQFRVVFEPLTEELKQVHRTIGRRLGLYASQAIPSFPADCSYAYRRHKSIKDNAAQHAGARVLLRADIRDFFPSISRFRVESILIGLKIAPDLSTTLSRIFCLEGTLSPGLSASALLANLACHELDRRMCALAQHYNATYTRYADDIAISGEKLPTKSEVADVLQTEGFILSQSKFRVTKRGQSQFVTGLSVTDSKRPHVPRAMKRRLRQELYYCRKKGIQEHLAKIGEALTNGVNRIDGTVTYVSFIEKGTSYDFHEPWNLLLARDDLSPRVHSRHDRPPIQKFVVIDETEFSLAGEKWLALGFALFSDRSKIEERIRQLLEDYLADPFSAGDRKKIGKEGLHFAQAHGDLKTSFTQQLVTLPFRCYVFMSQLTSGADYVQSYLNAFKWACAALFQRCDHQKLTILVEQNSKIRSNDLSGIVEDRYELLAKSGEARPLMSPEISIVTKTEATVSIPDFMLGVLSKYIETVEGQESSTAYTQFERLRDRYALIYDMSRNESYSRRNPFQASPFSAKGF